MRKTKIICTIGPASGSPEMIRRLIRAGMDVARLNFSHGTREEHGEKIRLIRSISDEIGKPVAILQDLCGPKIRVGELPEAGIALEPGQTFVLTSDPIRGNENRVSVSYSSLPAEVKASDRILLADGMMELVVRRITDTEIFCEVITGGTLTSHKGINLPTGTINVEALTEKDREDLDFGLANDVDYVALSFVRSEEDIRKAKEIISSRGKDTPVIAKIEKHEALDHIDAITEEADGIMVARGDLGVEIPLERVPGIQKKLIRKAGEKGKPVIIATQMLRSMVDAPRPTRAEANDVANAVLDGTDAVMLSEETATGRYPVEAVEYMGKIAENAEVDFPHDGYLRQVPSRSVPEAVAHASCVLADHLGATAIVAPTKSGFTAMLLSRYRPRPKIIALSPDKGAIRKLALCWGCIPGHMDETETTDEMIQQAAQTALGSGYLEKGDLVVITAGHPVWVAGTTKMIRVKRL
jgi:pyruvate kinase